MTVTGWQGSEPGDDAPFDLAMRGYDRRQVDERLNHLGAELAATGEALQQSRMHASELGEQLSIAIERLRRSGPATAQKDSFGFRVEKILRLAEEEAKELRAQGTADATAAVDRARAEADALHDESERVRAEAYHDAERIRAQAQARATTLVARVEAELANRQQSAERELSRLATARDQVWSELTKVRDQLRSALPRWPDGLSAAGPAGGAGLVADSPTGVDRPIGRDDPAGPVGPVEGAGPAHRRRTDDPDDGTSPVLPTQTDAQRASRHRQAPRQTPTSRRVGGGVS